MKELNVSELENDLAEKSDISNEKSDNYEERFLAEEDYLKWSYKLIICKYINSKLFLELNYQTNWM